MKLVVFNCIVSIIFCSACIVGLVCIIVFGLDPVNERYRSSHCDILKCNLTVEFEGHKRDVRLVGSTGSRYRCYNWFEFVIPMEIQLRNTNYTIQRTYYKSICSDDFSLLDNPPNCTSIVGNSIGCYYDRENLPNSIKIHEVYGSKSAGFVVGIVLLSISIAVSLFWCICGSCWLCNYNDEIEEFCSCLRECICPCIKVNKTDEVVAEQL